MLRVLLSASLVCDGAEVVADLDGVLLDDGWAELLAEGVLELVEDAEADVDEGEDDDDE